MNPSNLFTDRVAVVTGGAGLLGRAMVRTLAARGARVIIADTAREQAEALAKELGGETGRVHAVPFDITAATHIQTGVREIIARFQHIDVWVNNAYPRTADWNTPLESIPWDSWQKNIDSHLNGYCCCCQQVAEVMKPRRQGSIINMASIYGLVGPDFSIYEGTAMTMPAAYAAIKGGIIQFTRYLASYYGPHGVRANTISPGGILNDQPASFVERYAQKTPLRRMGCPEDIAEAVAFLASDAASYITGHNLVIDGGWSAI